MPIEIRELVIRATITDEASQEGDNSSGDAPGQDIIAECVEQVMEIIEQKKER